MLLQQRAFEAMDLRTFRRLFELDKLKYLAINHNDVEFTEIYKYTDVNTVLKFAAINGLVDIAKQAARDGGQMYISDVNEFRRPISRSMAEFILQRHNLPGLHISEIAVNDEIDTLSYNAVLNNDRWLMRRLGIDFGAADMDIMINNRRSIVLALIERGDVATLRDLLRRYGEHVRGIYENFFESSSIGRSGSWEMYEFFCELKFGRGVRLAIPRNAEDFNSRELRFNIIFVLGALWGGHFDIARRVMDNDDLHFRFVDIRAPDHFGMLATSKHWRFILEDMFEEELRRNGMVIDYDVIREYAIRYRLLDVVQYIEQNHSQHMDNSDLYNVNAAFDSSSAEMMKYILHQFRYYNMGDMQDHFDSRIASSSSQEIIALYLRMAEVVIDLNTVNHLLEQERIGFMLPNILQFLFTNIHLADRAQRGNLSRILSNMLIERHIHKADNVVDLFYRHAIAANNQEIDWNVVLNNFGDIERNVEREEIELFINVLHITPFDMDIVLQWALDTGLMQRPVYELAARHSAAGDMGRYDVLMAAFDAANA